MRPDATWARLAAIREAHAEQSRPWDPYPTCAACTRCACYQPVTWPCDVARVLAAVDAQAAWLAALDGDVISARNSALAFEGAYRDLEDAYHAQAARLAAVERANAVFRERIESLVHPKLDQGLGGSRDR